ncbi:MAG: phosphate ABC transporter substrate-binding protein PstS [Alphaproteobacteria bacterium]
MLKPFKLIALLGAVFFVAAGAARADSISGAGATFPYPIYAKWADAYKGLSGISLNYQSIGSGGGIKQIKAKTVDFGASDMPLKPEDLNEAGLVQFPMVMGGVVPVVNIAGVKPGDMKLTPSVLADIYLGKITKWDNPAIAKLNPGLSLPNASINVVHRSDGSGTTFIFTHYLSQVSPEWKSQVGENTSVEWPLGVGGKGNEGVASYTKQLDNSIGYVEYAYALQNKLVNSLLENAAGKFVAPNAESFQAAAANGDWAHAPGFYLLLTNQPGENSWPITGATFILMYKSQDKPDTARAVLKFFNWAYVNGGEMAAQLDYVPMPKNVVELVRGMWAKDIKGSDGKAIFDATMADNSK